MDNPLADPVLRSSPARRRGGLIRRSLRWLGRAIVLFIAITVILAAIYRFVPPPLTPLMVIRLFEGNWISKDWVSYEEISPNLVRAVIAAEDAGFCSHWGFDFEAIQKALRHNEKSRRLRGGSTISNQTAKNTFLWPGDTARDALCPQGDRALFHAPDRDHVGQEADPRGLSQRGGVGARGLRRRGRGPASFPQIRRPSCRGAKQPCWPQPSPIRGSTTPASPAPMSRAAPGRSRLR